jgi:hypothetical protein
MSHEEPQSGSGRGWGDEDDLGRPLATYVALFRTPRGHVEDLVWAATLEDAERYAYEQAPSGWKVDHVRPNLDVADIDLGVDER